MQYVNFDILVYFGRMRRMVSHRFAKPASRKIRHEGSTPSPTANMVYNYKFKGLVYPERVNFTLKGISNLEIEKPDFSISGSFEDFVIENCKLSLSFKTGKEINQETNPNIETLKNFIETICRTFIDSYCFVNSYNYDLTIDSVICKELKFEYQFPIIGEFGLKKNSLCFEDVINTILSVRDITSISASLADFRRSIKYPDATASYCLRAMESLRRKYFDDVGITDDNVRDRTGWEKMSKEIGVNPDSSYKKIQDFAKQNRHGVYLPISYEDRLEIMTFSRRVINAFFVWLNNQRKL